MSKNKKIEVPITLTASDVLDVEEIIEKDWKVAELPSEDEIAKEKLSNPKARNNINSRKNLAQYNKRSKEGKEKSIDNLRFSKNKTVESVKKDYFGSFSRDTLLKLFPVDELMDPLEQETYYSVLELYLNDFDRESLSAMDLDGILTLAINRVLEKRMLAVLHSRPSTLAEVMPSLQKIQQYSEKIKETLAVRRKDRIDPKTASNYTILDLALKFDADRKAQLIADYDKDVKGRNAFREKMDNIVKNEEI